MIGNTLKIIATLVLGYGLGWIVGAMSGAFLGGVPGLFFREIVDSNLAVPMSIFISLLLGVLLGFLATQFSNRIFTASDKPFVGVAIGVVISLIVVFFMDGIIAFSNTVTFDPSFYFVPVIYSGMVGGDIGSIVFSILGATRVFRDILEAHKEAGNQKERLQGIKRFFGMDSSDKEKNG
jgi:hypothetical protein